MNDVVYGTDRIEAVERRNNSASGNPRWRVTLNSGYVHKAAADAQVNYGIEEHVGQLARIGFRAGEIVSVEPATRKDHER